MNTIQIENCGPVEKIAIPIPEHGGIVVLRGRNEAGKTKTLETIHRLMGDGSAKIQKRDGSVLPGVAEGLGVRVTFGSSTRTRGELEAVALQGRLDLSDLIQPPLKSSDAADRVRIKTLLRLMGVQADPAVFNDLFSGRMEMEAILEVDTLRETDLVEMARRAKADLERAARAQESAADVERGHAETCREMVGEADLDAPCDARWLQEVHSRAIGTLAGLLSTREHAQKTRAAAEQAREMKDRHLADYHGPSVQDAAKRERELRKDVERLRRELASAERNLAAADAERKAAEKHAEMLLAWDATIERAAAIEDVTDAEIAAAEQALQAAQDAMAAGETIRKAREQAQKEARHRESEKQHRSRADALRDRARAIDGILSELIQCPGLTVRDGRIFTIDERRDRDVPFAERSMGWRSRFAVDVALPYLRNLAGDRLGLMTVSQEIWQGLDPGNRRALADHCRQNRVVLVTAEAADGDLRAEIERGAKEA